MRGCHTQILMQITGALSYPKLMCQIVSTSHGNSYLLEGMNGRVGWGGGERGWEKGGKENLSWNVK